MHVECRYMSIPTYHLPTSFLFFLVKLKTKNKNVTKDEKEKRNKKYNKFKEIVSFSICLFQRILITPIV